MMKRFIMLLGGVWIFMALNAQCNQDKRGILPSFIIEIIDNCDSIEWFLLDPIAEDSIGKHYAIKGQILSAKYDNDKDRIGALKATLIYPRSFEQKEIVKDCVYLPDIAFIMYAKEEKLSFSYSFYCDVCRFEIGNIKCQYDGELIRDVILQLTLEVYPNDRYLRKIAGISR